MTYPFDYAVLRVVPHVEREEFINAGVILFCDALEYLAARIALDESRLLAIAPGVDLDVVRRHLAAVPIVCAGGAPAGVIGELTPRERWHWLVSPRSTMLQTSAPHAGLCDAPERSLDHLIQSLVRCPAPRSAG